MLQPSQLPRLLVGLILFASAGLYTWPILKGDPQLYLVPLLFGVLAGLFALQLLASLPLLLWRIIYHRWIMRPSTRSGSAGWADEKDIKKAGLYRRKSNRYLLGLHENRALWVDIESSGLVLSPAGGGKTVGFVIPALCQNPVSMLVPDLKATLGPMTFALRQKKHKHKTVFINPTGKYEQIVGPADCYNLLQSVMDDWEDEQYHPQVVSKAKALALQLLPEPKAQGENKYFRNGARKFLTFSFLYVVVLDGSATLTDALRLLSDAGALSGSIEEAAYSNVLSGDLALIAKDLKTKYKQGDPKQTESFREGAVQALEVYSPSGPLAASTSKTTFRFSDMRKQGMTIYIMGDPTQAEVYEPWAAALMWNAINELIRYQNGKPVCLLCDEITNLKINRLPKLLTLLREFGVHFWLIVQSLQEWEMVYGPRSSDTLLSQTEVKLILNAQDHKTCQLISDMLGEGTIKAKNHNLGNDFLGRPSRSVSDAPRKLMTPDEVRRMDEAIAFIRNLRPAKLEKVGYQQITPWKRWVGVNPLFGKKFKKRTRLKL